jgi:hypothetical protein
MLSRTLVCFDVSCPLSCSSGCNRSAALHAAVPPPPMRRLAVKGWTDIWRSYHQFDVLDTAVIVFLVPCLGLQPAPGRRHGCRALGFRSAAGQRFRWCPNGEAVEHSGLRALRVRPAGGGHTQNCICGRWSLACTVVSNRTLTPCRAISRSDAIGIQTLCRRCRRRCRHLRQPPSLPPMCAPLLLRRRPRSVCLCPYLPETPVKTAGRVIILQHPFEHK